MAAVGALHLHHVPDAGRRRRVGQPRRGRLGAALVGPARQHRGQRGAAGGVGVGVECDVGAVRERLVEQGQQLRGPSPVDAEVHGGVGEVQRAPGLAGERHHLRVGLQCTGAVGAVVRAVVAAVGRHHPAQLGQLGVRGVHARGVGQAGRHAHRALRHSLGDQAPHGRQFVRGGRAVLPAGGQHPDAALRDQIGRVDGRALAVDAVQVAADRAPVEVDVAAVAVPAGDRLPDRREGGVVGGRVGQPVLAEHLQGDPLGGLRGVLRVAQDRQVRVCVHVDESRRQRESVRVQSAGAVQPRSAFRGDPCDASPAQGDVRAVGGGAGAVDDAGAADDRVHGVTGLRRRCGSGR